jgi:hypothetical protein
MTELGNQMIPPVNRFIGALQGITVNAGIEGGGEVLEVSESILANGSFNSDELSAIVKGFSDSSSGGAPLWRAIPFGLLHYRDLDKLQEDTEKACRLTHGHPSDIAAAVGMALAVARLLRMQEFDSLQFVREIAWFVKKIDQDAYLRIRGLSYPLRNELPFLCSNFTQPLEIFRAALYLFCQPNDLEAEAGKHDLGESSALPLAYTLMGSLGHLCRLEKPTIRIVILAEAFQKFAEGAGGGQSEGP